MTKETKNEIAKTGNTAVALSDDRPDFAKAGNRGSEDVTANEMVIPRLGLLQALSPEVNKRNPEYIEGAEQGIIFNTVTQELYGEKVTFIPVIFRREFCVWRDRNAGGGFRGAFPTEAEAEKVINEQENPEQYEAMETHQHFGLVVSPVDGSLSEVVLSLSRSKLKVSRRINTLVQLHGADRWAKAMTLSSFGDKSDKGEFYNFSVDVSGWVSAEMFQAGEKLYEIIKAGKADVDRNSGEESKSFSESGGSMEAEDL